MNSPSQMGLGKPGPAFDPLPPMSSKPLPPGTSQVPVTTGRGGVVIVQDGETISDLSQRHKVPISVIMSENRLKDPNIFPGMVLLIPKR